MQVISVQQQEVQRADKAEMWAAIANLAAKIKAPQALDEDDYRPTKRRASTARNARAFVLPIASHHKAPPSRATATSRAWQVALDPTACIQADEASHTQAQDPDSEI